MAKAQTWSRLGASLSAGAIAIAVNTALLEGADAIGFTTARGGLLKLLKSIASDLAPHLTLADTWNNAIAPATSGDLFRNGFHIVVGLLMALFYAYALEPVLPGKPWPRP